MFYVLGFVDEAVERRVVKAGFPHGYAKAMRERAEPPERDAEAAAVRAAVPGRRRPRSLSGLIPRSCA